MSFMQEKSKVMGTSNDNDVIKFAKDYALFIRQRKTNIISFLTTYETYHVACDEFERTLDILENLNENGAYFQGRIDNVITFLPK